MLLIGEYYKFKENDRGVNRQLLTVDMIDPVAVRKYTCTPQIIWGTRVHPERIMDDSDKVVVISEDGVSTAGIYKWLLFLMMTRHGYLSE